MRKHIADCQAQEVRRLASEAAADVQLQQLQGTVGSQNSDISTPLSAPPSPEVEPEPNLLPRNYPVAQPPPLDDENDLGSDLVGARFWKEPLGSCTVVATGTYLLGVRSISFSYGQDGQALEEGFVAATAARALVRDSAPIIRIMNEIQMEDEGDPNGPYGYFATVKWREVCDWHGVTLTSVPKKCRPDFTALGNSLFDEMAN